MQVAEGMISTARPYTWKGADVEVAQVERRLTDLWKEVSVQQADRSPVRTRVFNLVVYTRSQEEARRAVELLDRVPQRHPSRTIILVCDRAYPTSRIDADLAVHCRAEGDVGTPSCYERAILSVYGRAAEHLASVCVPLLVPQLATYLWWPGQPPFGHRVFHRLLTVADQLIVDSAQFTQPGDGLSCLASLCGQCYRVNDVHWARMTPWREIIAQFFDGSEFLPYVRFMRSITLEFAAERNASGTTAAMLLLLGWVASRLDWEPDTALDSRLERDTSLAVLDRGRLIPITVQVRDRGDAVSGMPLGCRIEAQPPGMAPASFHVHRAQEEGHVEVAVSVGGEDRPRRVVPVAVEGDAEILSDELEMTGQDNLYDSVVRAASRLAGREVLAPA